MRKMSTSDLNKFVNEFDFPEPDWTTLPEGFPNLSKNGLSKEEGHLLDGIKLAWVTSEGRSVFFKSVAKRTSVVTAIVFVFLIGKSLLTSNQTITKTVSAKTVGEKVGEIVEATRSAIFRK